MDAWPADGNELLIRLTFWFSLNYWLVLTDADC
jgi:hypothetical protein